MADASSIRKTTSPLTPPLVPGSTTQYQAGPFGGALPGTNVTQAVTASSFLTSLYGNVDDARQQFASSAGFYESAIRFQMNPPGYAFSFTDVNGVARQRSTGQAYVNSGQQWVPMGNVVLTVPIAVVASEEVALMPIFIADRPYNVLSVSETHTATGGASAAAALVQAPGTPQLVAIDPTGAGSGFSGICTVTPTTGAIASGVIINGGQNYSASTYLVVVGNNFVPATTSNPTAAASAGAAVVAGPLFYYTLTSGSIVGATLNTTATGYTAGYGYQVPSVFQGVTGAVITNGGSGYLPGYFAGAATTAGTAGSGATLSGYVNAAGVVTGLWVDAPGSGYTAANVAGNPTCSSAQIIAAGATGGTGFTCALTIGQVTSSYNALNLTSAVPVNTVQYAPLNVAQPGVGVQNTQLATGSRLGLAWSGTLTAYSGVITVVLQPS